MKTDEIAKYVSDGFDRAKGGEAKAIYRKVLEIFQAGELPLRSHYAFGWIAYYALHQSLTHEIEERKRILAIYLKLSVTRPHKLHSMILTEAIRLYKDARDMAYVAKGRDCPTFSIVRFVSLWDLSNLRPGDWRRKEHEGTPLSATAERLITVYVDELEQSRQTPTAEITTLMQKALADFPDTDTLLAQQATLMLLSGRRDEAAEMLRRALLGAPAKFFLWHRLAMLTSPQTDLKLRIALLYKALTAPGPEKFKGRVRLALAEGWIACQAWPQALWELMRVKDTYEANAWHLPRSFAATMSQIPQGTKPQDPGGWYRRIAPLADDEIHAALPEIATVKTYHKAPAPPRPGFNRPTPAAWRVSDIAGRNFWLQPHRFGIPADLPNGTRLRIKVHNGKPVAARLEDSEV